VRTFLVVGGTGYVVDVATFNLLLSVPPLTGRDPVFARVVAVGVAMVVTYLGNRFWTWRGQSSEDLARTVTLFVVFNVIGMGFSVACLFTSHHLLGLTSRLADNISANGVGMLLGTAFRFWSYRRYVFGQPDGPASNPDLVPTAAAVGDGDGCRPDRGPEP
jgi:putative flippase GtrA